MNQAQAGLAEKRPNQVIAAVARSHRAGIGGSETAVADALAALGRQLDQELALAGEVMDQIERSAAEAKSRQDVGELERLLVAASLTTQMVGQRARLLPTVDPIARRAAEEQS